MFKSAKLVSNAAHFHGDDLVDWSIIDAQSTLSPEFPPPFPEYTNQLTFYSANKQEIRVAVPTGKISRIITKITSFPVPSTLVKSCCFRALVIQVP